MKTKWNQFYTDHGRYYMLPHPGLKKVINKFRDLDIHKILDLGCGSGRHLVALAKAKFNVTGIDHSPAAVDLAQKWLQTIKSKGRVSIADIHRELKIFPKNSFDAILAINSIHYTDLQTFEITLGEINRILVTNGLLFLVVPSNKTEIVDFESEQLFFNESKIKKIIENNFKILELSSDNKQNITILASEK